MRWWTIFLALALVAAESSEGRPQPASSRVVLALVTDQAGRPVLDLGPDDFVVTEDGEAREILDVRIADYPLVLLIDNGAEASADLPEILDAAVRFISRVGQRAIAAGTLAEPPAMTVTFADDRPAALDRLREITPSPNAALAPLQALAMAARTIRASGTTFSAIVVVAAPPAAPAAPEPTSLMSELLASRAIVHVVTKREATEPAGSNVLRDLAEGTGGRFTAVFAAGSLPFALDRVAERLGSEVMIDYLVPAGAPAAEDVKVGVRVPGARIRGLGVSRQAANP
jgi:hypothetical protein